jgi:hypothetical protein
MSITGRYITMRGGNIIGTPPVIIPPSLLLDLYPATAAYSVRKLRTAYTGACMRVRRSSDNTEQDIGFSGNDLDTAALLSFVGASNGRVVTWYDQGLNNANVSNSVVTNQPKIVDNGVIIQLNGLPALNLDGDDFLIYGSNILTNDSLLILSVDKTQLASSAFNNAIFDASTQQIFSGAVGARFDNFSGNFRFGTLSSFLTTPSTTNVQKLRSAIANNVGRYVRINGTLLNSQLGDFRPTFTGVNQHKVGAFTNGTNQSLGAVGFLGEIQEVLVFQGSPTNNFSQIETNINTYYGIYP